MITETKYNFLINQYKNKIYSYALYILHNKMDADDVAQEVLIKIWQNIDKFNVLAAKTWIMKTTHNLCIDYLRKRKVDGDKFPLNIDDISEFKGIDDDIVGKIEESFSEMRLKKEIYELPNLLKSVFIMYEIQEMKYKDISKILDIPLNSVKVYLFRARKTLQKKLIKEMLKEAI